MITLIGDSHLTETSSRGTVKLPARLRGAGFLVESLAIGGLDTGRALGLEFTARPHTSSIFCFGSNDAAPWKEVPIDEFESNYFRLLAMVHTSQAVILGPPSTVEARQPVGARTNRRLGEYSAVAKVVARRSDASFISLLDVLADDGRHHVDDGVHLNDAGYALVAQLLVELLSPSEMKRARSSQLASRKDIYGQ